VFDLLLYPVSKNQVTETSDKAIILDNANPGERTGNDSSTIRYLPVALTLFLLLGGSYKLSRKHKKMQENKFQEGKFNILGLLAKVLRRNTGSETGSEFGKIGEKNSVRGQVTESAENSEKAPQKKTPLPADLLEILDVIRGHKGRITQKDLRGKLDYSEVKVSLLLSELEKRGRIKKLKNGRENIVILVYEEHQN